MHDLKNPQVCKLLMMGVAGRLNLSARSNGSGRVMLSRCKKKKLA